VQAAPHRDQCVLSSAAYGCVFAILPPSHLDRTWHAYLPSSLAVLTPSCSCRSSGVRVSHLNLARCGGATDGVVGEVCDRLAHLRWGCLAGWLADRLVGCLAGWLAGWMAGWGLGPGLGHFAGWSAGWAPGLVGAGLCTEMTGWLAGL
jgi:hypothetical protein